MKRHKKAHAAKSHGRSKSTRSHRKVTTEDAATREQRSDITDQPERAREGHDALTVHEGGPATNDIAA